MFYRPPNYMQDCYGKRPNNQEYPPSDHGNLQRDK